MIPQTNKTICGDCREIMSQWDDECIDMVITSPPYWSLRDYKLKPLIWDGDENCEHKWEGEKGKAVNNKNHKGQIWKKENYKDGFRNSARYMEQPSFVPSNQFCSLCGAWKGQLGLEPTFDLYIKHLCDIFDEVKRGLKKEGSIWVNMGDSYNGSGGCGWTGLESKNWEQKAQPHRIKNYPVKSLCCIPDRFKIEMINRGWICRNTIIWHKPNPMPSSAKDRFTVDFEYLFFFVKNKRYYFEQQFENVKQCSIERLNRAVSNKNKWVNGADGQTKQRISQPRPNRNKYKGYGKKGRDENLAISTHEFEDGDYLVAPFNPNVGRNMRCVWTIPTMPCSEAHFAVFPEQLLMIPIKAGCPEFICKKCGKARIPIFEPSEEYKKLLGRSWTEGNEGALIEGLCKTPGKLISCLPDYRKIGYTDCGCNAGFEGGIVLDPFAGRGTTGIVAQRLGRRYILIDLSPEYVKMAKRNLSQGWLV